MHRYFHSGLSVASEIELPEWAAFAGGDADEPDVTIVLSEGHMPDFPANGAIFAHGDTVSFAVEGVGGWKLERGCVMTLYPSLAADPRELRLFTLGSAWGLLGYQRGHAMWHGSAVERGGRAVLFCGDSGEGKSTMAAAAIASGAALVADDLSRVELGGGAALLHPSSARIKLWSQAIDQLGWRDRVTERDWMREDKFHCSVPSHHAGDDPLPLAAIVVLATGETLALEPLIGGEALKAVLAGTIYRPDALEAMGLWGEQGALAARVVAQVPVFRLTRPRDLAVLDSAVRLVWEGLSLG
ncbi:hypothetical protein [Erythrobacter mangrovi]|uniref:Serine kinase n=1 Tax=Erythrobacter mangrovi TaxID=2739433 RepID=A0A7D3XXH2_9SPHN|nr:hypothetical protein [Erythrobacter mangrovi]QKG69992.1 hypothetical protein HQR01_00630 [Erythrobacter mangrovi]